MRAYTHLVGRILIIGATGTVGRQVASQLAQTGAKARALVRRPATARLPEEMEVMSGDFSGRFFGREYSPQMPCAGGDRRFALATPCGGHISPLPRHRLTSVISPPSLSGHYDNGHTRVEYVLTGPQSLTQFEQIATIGHAIGRKLRVEEMSPEEARHEWLPTSPASVVNMLLDAWGAAFGSPALVTSTFQEITRSMPRTFLDWATDHADEFRPAHPRRPG